ncbi:MAG: trypsin-like peptidase domain-containing protein [bacterium]|nr:trypsin-like peptidase domain-containing protein [bacterium]
MKKRLIVAAGLLLLVGFVSTNSSVSALVNRLVTSEEKRIVKLIRSVDNAVVSVVISKDLPIVEQYIEDVTPEGNTSGYRIGIPRFRQTGTEKRKIGGGTAFFIGKDGLLATNEHVVHDEAAEYTVIANDGKVYQAQVVARDREKDLALLKVQGPSFPIVRLSSNGEAFLGQTVIAIGNALAELRNTVSKGIISGIGRNVTTADGRNFEKVIQTDTAINTGNSGGPLLNTSGEAIGVNFSTVVGAENIGFSIPISELRQLLEEYRK